MANVTHESTTHRAGRSNGNVREGTIKWTIPQPNFGWQLQGATQKVSNDIGMTDNNFKFVMILIPVVVCVGRFFLRYWGRMVVVVGVWFVLVVLVGGGG